MGETRTVISWGDDLYPSRLQELESPPEALYVRGDVSTLGKGGLSIIGARRATPYGLTVAEMAGRIAAECGLVVISGGAMGCDAAALRGAQKAGGETVVIPGSGADWVYPASSRDVFDHAAGVSGCVVSMEGWNTPPQKHTFPKRNRLIAALCDSLLVAEAGERTGTSSTADVAATLGRRIYAIPGSIFSPESAGANKLIASGAAIISSEEDLEMQISLDFGVIRLMSQGHSRSAGRVMSALVANPMRPDDLANHLGLEPLEMFRILADYEASGVVQRLFDGRYAPSRDALLGKVSLEDRGEGLLQL